MSVKEKMLVGDVMTSPIVTVSRAKSVREAVQVMNREEVGSVIVTEDDNALGIVTERDVLRFIAGGGDDETTIVGEIMSSPLVVVKLGTVLEKAVKHMIKSDVKKLPVMEGGRLVGIVTLADVAGVHPILMDKLKSLIEEDVAKRFQKYLKPYYVV